MDQLDRCSIRPISNKDTVSRLNRQCTMPHDYSIVD